MKIQSSKSKIQGKSKSHSSNPTALAAYPEVGTGSWTLQETSGNGESPPRAFDLEERTALFGEAVIHLCKKTPATATNSRLINQLVGCGTSIGANYCEASEKVSSKDFKNCISHCVKEAKETKFFLRMLAAAEPTLAEEARVLYREARELHLIFAAIFRK
jgi:four helix bundle protein